jgi:F-type H+-transporting ATPase subunit beta
MEKFFSQPFFVAEQFTGMNWSYVKLEDTISGFEKLINWELDEISEEFFMYKGTIEEVIEASKK